MSKTNIKATRLTNVLGILRSDFKSDRSTKGANCEIGLPGCACSTALGNLSTRRNEMLFKAEALSASSNHGTSQYSRWRDSHKRSFGHSDMQVSANQNRNLYCTRFLEQRLFMSCFCWPICMFEPFVLLPAVFLSFWLCHILCKEVLDGFSTREEGLSRIKRAFPLQRGMELINTTALCTGFHGSMYLLRICSCCVPGYLRKELRQFEI